MNRCIYTVLLLIVLLLLEGCESSNNVFLLDAKDLLGVDETTFRKLLSEQFIWEQRYNVPVPFHVFGPRLNLPGQQIWITYGTSDSVEFPGDLGKAARLFKEIFEEEKKEKPREAVYAIEIILPYIVLQREAIRMLGYPAMLLGKHSEEGLWRDVASGHTITVIHLKELNKTRIIISVASRNQNIR
ncbi:hypothetical protein C6502_01265 [Candidatus Poribacteria bacterium]|nr:MAG: hypothetical protein C6502_01265 [Candidatus Poribacteria bacterium]